MLTSKTAIRDSSATFRKEVLKKIPRIGHTLGFMQHGVSRPAVQRYPARLPGGSILVLEEPKSCALQAVVTSTGACVLRFAKHLERFHPHPGV